MRTYFILPLLPLVAACSGGGAPGTSPTAPQTAGEMIVTNTATGAVVSNDKAYDSALAVYSAAGDNPSTINKTMPGLANGENLLQRVGVSRWETEVDRTVVASIGANGSTVSLDRIGGVEGSFVETYRLYDPNDDLVAIESRASNATTAAVVGSVEYWGQWNGEVDGKTFEDGAVNIVVNGGTGAADLHVYHPTAKGMIIDEDGTLTYDASSQKITGSVVFNSDTQQANGQTLLSLAGHTQSLTNASAPELVTGHAYTDSNQPFNANIGIIGALDD